MNDDKAASTAATPFVANFKPFSSECAEPGHGTFTVMTWKGRASECPKCRTSREEEERRHREEAESRERHERALDAAGLVGRYRDATFGTYVAKLPKQRTVVKACIEFADNFSSVQAGGLWLLGPAGVGKSHLGASIAQAVMFQRDQRAIVVTAREIIRTIRSTWHRDARETEGDAIDRFGDVPLLVLDEVGVGFGTDAEIAQLFDVIDLRYQLRRPTVLLSNLNEPQIKAMLGDRLFERLREGATVLACNWASHRAKGPFISGSESGAAS